MEGFLTHSVPVGPCHALRAAQDRPRESSRPSEVPSALQSVPGALSSEQSLSFGDKKERERNRGGACISFLGLPAALLRPFPTQQPR